MNKIKNIQNYLIELYGMMLKDGELNSEAKKMTNDLSVKQWDKLLKDYSEEEILFAIDYYYKFKNNKTSPKLSQIQKILNLGNTEKTYQKDENYNNKPICPIIHWQEDFDNVIQKACIEGIIYNPYWSELESIKDQHREFIKDFDYHKTIFKWKDALEKAKRENREKYEKIKDYDIMVQYTFAYRMGCLYV